MESRLSFLEFMSILDKFTIEKAEEYDFRDLTVHCNKVMSNEIIFLKNRNGKVVETFLLKKRK